MPSRGYTSSARVASPPSAFYEVLSTDFGLAAPGANGTTLDGGWSTSNLAYNAAGGNLGGGTAHCKITYVTAQGESKPSSDATVSISAGSGAFTVTFPVIPSATSGSPEATAAPVLGFRIYSNSSTSTLLNRTTDFDATTQAALISVACSSGTLTNVIPVSKTTAQVQTYGAGAAVPVIDQSGIQLALPVIGANTTVDYYLRVPNSGGLWEIQKSVEFMRPQGATESAGITTANMDCLAPVYPGVSTAVSLDAYMVLNGYLFRCTASGTTAATFIGYSGFNTAKFGTTTDGTVTWTCYGKSVLIRIHFSNSSGSSASPVAQEYDFWEN